MRPEEITPATREILEAVRTLEPEIRAASALIEAERKLPPALAHKLMEAGVFRMGVPRIYNGWEIDPLGQVRVVEELSRIEGSVGWLSMISSAGSFIAAFLDAETANRLFGNVDSVLAGQIRPPQRADIVDGGYRLSGTFHFASGSHHASVFTCGVVLYENGAPRQYGRRPEFRVLLVPRADVTLVDVWDTTGMRGTGSNDFVVENVFVPSAHSTTMSRQVVAGPLYAFPPLFLVSHAGVPLGIARSALDFVEELCLKKASSMPGVKLLRDDPAIQETIASCEAQLGAARAYVYATLEDLWATLCDGGKPSPLQRAQYRMMITYSHEAAKRIVQTLYDLAATSSIFRSGRLDRDLRDIMTACQHRVVHLRMYRPAGRLLLGLESEEMMF
ncbi:MAG TPA: acyl-CoA dehydrogenase family protein [Candidatus Binataceae bacterium]|nr:acyl-CoA dehydrogenase family protein [Candidatus Binataceae bacterium]